MLPPPPVATEHASVRLAIKWALGLFLILAATMPAWGAIATDQVKSTNRSGRGANITSPSFSTTAANELLLAFVSTDARSAGITVTGVTGAGLTWALVRRTNTQLGTAEVWRAFAPSTLTNVTVRAALSQSVSASITVVTFTGTDTTGASGAGAIGATASANASSGAPSASLVTTRNGSWVFGVGDDWDNATARSVPSGQTMVNQYLATTGDTFWVQRQTAATATSGTPVTINDTAPTGDRYNLTIVEVLAAPPAGPTYAVSGSITPTPLATGSTVTLTQGATTIATTTADASGNFSFPSVANGVYTVTPTKSAVNFSPASQSVTVNGAPATVPIPFTASPQTVSGTATPAALASGASVALTQGATTIGTAIVDATGAYGFTGVANGTYTVTPTKTGVTFSPTSRSVNVSGNTTVPNFTAAPQTWTVSGTITPVNSGVGTLVSLDGTASDGSTVHLTATANASAVYNITGVQNGSYTLTPSKDGYTFTPPPPSITVNNGNVTANFAATPIATYTISGTVSPAAGGAGTLLTLSGSPSTTTTADSNGLYSFAGLGNNTYTVTPSKTNYTFNPPNRVVVVSGADMPNVDFTAQPQPPPPANFPDLSVMVPTGKISITGTGTSRSLQYTHDTYEGGSGPLVIQPAYNPATGNYQGTQNIYLFSAGKWTLAQQLPIAGVFIFDSDHGHFHFPFASFGLYTVAAGGGIGTPVALSPKISHCIADSFIYNSALPNAGWPGNLGPCTNPTAAQGIDIGAVDEYDQNDAGQSIAIGSVPDGTYWLKILIDPDNFMFESDKSNNETDVQLTIAGTKVTVLQTVVPVLPPPPSITLTSPGDLAAVSGTVTLNASTATGAVQFMVDGEAFGTPVPSAPYTLNWDSTTVPNGSHWLAAQTTDSASGVTGTSAVSRVTVANGGNKPPQVTVSNPPAGSTVSATIILGATVADANPVTSVQFYVDGSPLGSPLTASPYLMFWDTLGLDGQHTLTASAVDSLGLSATSDPVTVTVDNSHPANTIGTDATVFTDAQGTMTSPPFSTTTPSDLLIAFIAYDGPSNGTQTATVSGAGLPWTLLVRSNTQRGTSEIWAAKASDFLSNATVIAQPGSGNYHGSLVVVAFTNAAGPGIVNRAGGPSGAPDVFIPGVTAGNWVFAVGNDWDNAVARTPVSGQVLVHQRVDTATGDTFWVQSTAAPLTATALVDIHDNAPTNDQWNYAAVEVVATRQ
jgi:hypothetical protein